MHLSRSVLAVVAVTVANASSSSPFTRSASEVLPATPATAATVTVPEISVASGIIANSYVAAVPSEHQGRGLPDSLPPFDTRSNTKPGTPEHTSEKEHIPTTKSKDTSSISPVYYSTSTKADGHKIVIVNTVVFLTATLTGEAGVTTTKKVPSVKHVTSTYYVLPTTITASLNVTKTVTASPSTSTVPASGSSSSSEPVSYCLNADDNTMTPCPTSTTSDPAGGSTSEAASHAVNLNGAAKTATAAAAAARFCAVVAAVAALFCMERLGPVSLAFVVADVLIHQGLGSLVFVSVGLLVLLSGGGGPLTAVGVLL